ncbi:hypothetical protein Tco_0640848, partial [Tanacetum coccineum]
AATSFHFQFFLNQTLIKIHGSLSLMCHLQVEKRVQLWNHEEFDHA